MIDDIMGFLAAFLVAWLGLAGGFSYGYNFVKTQIPLSMDLVKEGIYGADIHKKVLTTGILGTLFLVGVSATVVFWTASLNGAMGWLMACLGCSVGLFKSRHMVGNTQGNVARFVKTHLVYMDKEKAAIYFKEKYGLS